MNDGRIDKSMSMSGNSEVPFDGKTIGAGIQ